MDKFNYLGTLQEWLNRDYKDFKINILDQDLSEKNIPIFISTFEEVGLRLFCTISLSNAIRNKKRSKEELRKNIVVKVIKDDGTSFFRLSELVVDIKIGRDGEIQKFE